MRGKVRDGEIAGLVAEKETQLLSLSPVERVIGKLPLLEWGGAEHLDTLPVPLDTGQQHCSKEFLTERSWGHSLPWQAPRCEAIWQSLPGQVPAATSSSVPGKAQNASPRRLQGALFPWRKGVAVGVSNSKHIHKEQGTRVSEGEG